MRLYAVVFYKMRSRDFYKLLHEGSSSQAIPQHVGAHRTTVMSSLIARAREEWRTEADIILESKRQVRGETPRTTTKYCNINKN